MPKAEGRWQEGLAKPPKAISKPPQSHILGIDSGVQRHPKASLKPHQSHTKATSRLHQGYTKATPRLHQGHTKATPRPHQGHTKATSKPPSSPRVTLLPNVCGGPAAAKLAGGAGSSTPKPPLHLPLTPTEKPPGSFDILPTWAILVWLTWTQ